MPTSVSSHGSAPPREPEKERDENSPVRSSSEGRPRQAETSPIEQTSPPPPPNGGFTAWSQVFGAFFLFFNSWGVINSFGVFQSYLETTMLSERSPSEISWIGTFQGFLLFLVGVITGPIFDKGYLRTLIVTGTVFVVFGLMMTSLATEYYQFFLALGICIGFGSACLFVPSVAIVATYFTTKRALGTGITAAGGSVGGVIYPIMFRKLVSSVGFGWATRAIGFVVLATLIPSIVIMQMRLPPPSKARSLLDLSAFREPRFNVFCLGLFLAFVGLYFPFFYLPTYAAETLGTSQDLSFYLLAILNATSVFGRIVPGLLADKLGSVNTIIPCALAATVLAYAWLGIHSVGGVVVFACLYGFFSGAIVSLPPTIVAGLSPHMGIVGTRMGMCFSFAGLGLLIGNPIAGALLDLEGGVFWKGEVFSATLLLGGGMCFLALRFMQGSKAVA